MGKPTLMKATRSERDSLAGQGRRTILTSSSSRRALRSEKPGPEGKRAHKLRAADEQHIMLPAHSSLKLCAAAA